MKEARDTGGCENGKSFEEDIYWRHIKRISFCTVFRSDSQDKLQIPKKFADNMKSNILHQKMTLKGPSGATWEVNLIRSGNDLFLQDGWQEFANAYSLQENDILIFKYDRNSSFNIKIFNGECEKITAYFVKKCGHVYPAVENQKKRVISETTENEICTATKKSCKNSGTEPVNHGIRGCVTTSKKILSNRKRVQSAINLVRKKAASRSMMGKPVSGETEPAKQNEHSSLTSNEVSNQSGIENTALHAKRAEPSLDKNEVPHQSGFDNIALPAKRAETATQHKRNSLTNTALSAKRVETESAKQHKHNSLTNNVVPPQSGIMNTALPAKRVETERAKQHKHNNLTNNEVPHQSGFESIALPATRGETELAKQPEKYILIKQELTETISPGIQKVASSPETRGRPRKTLCAPADIEYISNRRPITDEEKTNAMRKAASELTENSFFTALPVSSCYKHFFLTIPARFAMAHLGLRNQDVYLFIGKKKWITKFSFSRGGLGQGWKKFALNNNLEESDVCLFKLINQESGEPVMLDVTIFRVVDDVTPLTLSILQ